MSRSDQNATFCSPQPAQAKNVINNIGDVFRVSVPMFLYFGIMWIGTLVVTRKFHSTYEQCVTQVNILSSLLFTAVATCSPVWLLLSRMLHPNSVHVLPCHAIRCHTILKTCHAPESSELHGVFQQL